MNDEACRAAAAILLDVRRTGETVVALPAAVKPRTFADGALFDRRSTAHFDGLGEVSVTISSDTKS